MIKIKQKIKLLTPWIVILSLVFLGIIAVWVSTFKIPDLQSFEERKVAESTKIYDKTGEILLFDVYDGIKRTLIPFEEISQYIKDATLAIEDAEFYEHDGIKITSIFRAILVNFGSLSFTQGGSTITQQVVKNSLLTNEKLISRKIKEWVLALKLENILTKNEIFNIYLNEIPYGGNIYGVEEASQAFFGKSASEVSIAQAAYLASLPQAPSYYSPYGNHLDRLNERKNLVLKKMLEQNFITQEEFDSAKEEEVEFRPRSDQGIKAPHFVMFVRDILEEKYGEEVLENGGLRVITTLDYELQEKGEQLALEYAKSNEKNYNAENLSLVAIDPETGGILTMIGSRDYFDEDIDGNFNVSTAHRQPGSAFKPFAYATAFSKGYTPDTVIFDLPTVFTDGCTPQGKGNNCYMPGNYDNIFRGPVTMKEALAQSINVPAVKTLYLAGLEDTFNLARAMGLENLANASRYGLTLVLGGGEVSLLDMTSAYGVWANDGIRLPYQAILEIKDKDGNVIYRPTLEPRRVVSEQVSWQISDILSSNVLRAPAFGSDSYLHFPTNDVAVKTGTTNDYRDAWIVGYTPKISVGAWAGNNDNSPMEKKIAGFIIAPFWRAFMNEALKEYPGANFTNPNPDNSIALKPILRGKWQGGDSYFLDKISGKLATEYTPEETLEEIVTGDVRSILYWVSKSNPRGPQPQNPERDPQFVLWDYPVVEWAKRQGFKSFDLNDLPKDYDDVHVPKNFPEVEIIEPKKGDRFKKEDTVEVRIEAMGKYSIKKAEFYLNGSLIGESDSRSLSLAFIPEEVGYQNGENELRIVVVDSVYNRSESEIKFDIR